MASLGIGSVGNQSLFRNRSLGIDVNSNRSFMISMKRRGLGISATLATSPPPQCVNVEPYLVKNKIGMREIEKVDDMKEGIAPEKLDEWMRDSVVDIVKNLRDAPLLLHVYSNNNGSNPMLKMEKAVPDDWAIIRGKWGDKETQVPEGIILVEELNDNKGIKGEEDDYGCGTRIWGVLIQGKGLDCGPACYLLKTCRVESSPGLYGTHFCLVRVKNFWETAQSQLANCWLVQ